MALRFQKQPTVFLIKDSKTTLSIAQNNTRGNNQQKHYSKYTLLNRKLPQTPRHEDSFCPCSLIFTLTAAVFLIFLINF